MQCWLTPNQLECVAKDADSITAIYCNCDCKCIVMVFKLIYKLRLNHNEEIPHWIFFARV